MRLLDFKSAPSGIEHIQDNIVNNILIWYCVWMDVQYEIF